ncbi:uncharacterized protein LOC144734801 [Lampetra planeri]
MVKGREGLGVQVKGGHSSRSGGPHGLLVTHIDKGGAAERDGRLLPGDELLMINGRPLVGLSHHEAVALLRSSSGTVQLVVARESGTDAATQPAAIPDAPQNDVCTAAATGTSTATGATPTAARHDSRGRQHHHHHHRHNSQRNHNHHGNHGHHRQHDHGDGEGASSAHDAASGADSAAPGSEKRRKGDHKRRRTHRRDAPAGARDDRRANAEAVDGESLSAAGRTGAEAANGGGGAASGAEDEQREHEALRRAQRRSARVAVAVAEEPQQGKVVPAAARAPVSRSFSEQATRVDEPGPDRPPCPSTSQRPPRGPVPASPAAAPPPPPPGSLPRGGNEESRGASTAATQAARGAADDARPTVSEAARGDVGTRRRHDPNWDLNRQPSERGVPRCSSHCAALLDGTTSVVFSKTSFEGSARLSPSWTERWRGG